MAGGENSAKEVIIKQAEHFAEKLSNGHAADPETQGNALALVIEILKPIYRANFVTEEGLVEKLKSFRDTCPVYSQMDSNGDIKPKEKKTSGINNMSIGAAVAYLGTLYALVKIFIEWR